MLGWLTGPSRPNEDMDGPETTLNQSSLPEPPETPAPVFALRAFKTALFGTPHQPTPEARRSVDVEDVNIHKSRLTKDNRVSPQESTPVRREAKQSENQDVAPNPAKKVVPFTSPARPAGILLTPGTGTTRRKTVSFGDGVVDNEGKRRGLAGRSGLPNDFPGKFPSPWTPRDANTDTKRKRNSFTEALYEVSSLKPMRSCDAKGAIGDQSEPSNINVGSTKPRRTVKTNHGSQQDTLEGNEPTIDLVDPKSQSGRYWKLEYEQYASRTKKEMKRLIKYKQLAKSYAKKKDMEAINLGEKLRDEKEKVSKMEKQISSLAAELALLRHKDGGADAEQAEMMKHLTQKTALALEYKQRVNEFEAALEEGNGLNVGHMGKRNASPGTTDTITQASLELKKAREQANEINSLREDLALLQRTLRGVEAKANRLDEEKQSLENLLAKAKDSYENSRQGEAEDDRQTPPQQQLEAQIEEYKHLLAQARVERHQTKKAVKERFAERESELRREISSLRADLTFAREALGGKCNFQTDLGPKERAWYENVIGDLQKQIQALRSRSDVGDQGFNLSESEQAHRETAQGTLHATNERSLVLSNTEQKKSHPTGTAAVEKSDVDVWLLDNPRRQIGRAARSRSTSNAPPQRMNKNPGAGMGKPGGERPLGELSLNPKTEFDEDDDRLSSPNKLESEDHAQSFNLSIPALPSPEMTSISSVAPVEKQQRSNDDGTTPGKTFSQRTSSPQHHRASRSTAGLGVTPVSKPLKRRDISFTGHEHTERKLDLISKNSNEQSRRRLSMDPGRAAAAQARIAERQRLREQKRTNKENVHA